MLILEKFIVASSLLFDMTLFDMDLTTITITSRLPLERNALFKK